MDIYYIDGKFVKEDEAVISVKDMIVLRGYGAFDFLRTYNKRPFYLKEHCQRLHNSCAQIGLHCPWSIEEISDIVMQTLEHNPQHDEYNIRLVVTGGISPDSITPQDNSKLMVMATGLHPLPAEWYTDGAKIITSDIERFIPGAKSTNYLAAVIAMQAAREAGAIESIYVDRNQRVLEGTTTNLFMFMGDKLVTSGDSILPGVSRLVLLDILKQHFDLEIRDVFKKELPSVEEAFLSASNKEIVPIVTIDDLTVGNGKVGPRTQTVMEIFREFTTRYGQGA